MSRKKDPDPCEMWEIENELIKFELYLTKIIEYTESKKYKN